MLKRFLVSRHGAWICVSQLVTFEQNLPLKTNHLRCRNKLKSCIRMGMLIGLHWILLQGTEKLVWTTGTFGRSLFAQWKIERSMVPRHMWLLYNFEDPSLCQLPNLLSLVLWHLDQIGPNWFNMPIPGCKRVWARKFLALLAFIVGEIKWRRKSGKTLW